MQRWSVSMCRHVDMLERKLKIKVNKLLLDTNLYVPYLYQLIEIHKILF